VDVAARLEVVERENELLRERIVQLEAMLMGNELPPIEFGLTGSEGRVFGMLMQRTHATKDALMAALYRDLGKDEAELKIVDVFICKLRRKLKPFGIQIVTRWGNGYEMPAASKQLVREMMPATSEAA
jgi:two-component system cell cycle response regulator CtrA